MGGIQFTFSSGGAPTTCTQGKLHFEWEEAAAMMHSPPHVASNWDKKREKSIEWGVQQAEEQPSDCDCTPPWPTGPPTTHYKLHPWSNTV